MSSCNIFQEDEVLLLSGKQYKCGLVTICSEFASSDEEDDEDDLIPLEKVKRGNICVAWHPDGNEEVVQENKVIFPVYCS